MNYLMMNGVLKKLQWIFLMIVFTQCTFSRYAKKCYDRAGREKPFDVVIVPGIPYEGRDTGTLMKMRLYWAKHLYDNGYTRNIIFSGSAVYSPYVEGVAMKIMSDSLGIPPANTFAETRAEHSTENTYYGWKMAREMGFEKVALATDQFQSILLRRFMRKYCKGMKAIPLVPETFDVDAKALPAINPAAAYKHNFVPITDRETFWQRLRGTLGKRVRNEVKAEAKSKQKSEKS